MLGGFRLSLDDLEIAGFHQTRRHSLLAFPILHCHTPCTRQQLASTFWPDSSESQALTNLRRELHHLEQHLPHFDAFVLVERRRVQWQIDASCQTDVAEFERPIQTAAKAAARARLSASSRCSDNKLARLFTATAASGLILTACSYAAIAPS